MYCNGSEGLSGQGLLAWGAGMRGCGVGSLALE
jgi:hypothetical protein